MGDVLWISLNIFIHFQKKLDLSYVTLNQNAKKQLQDVITHSKISGESVGNVLFVCSSKNRFQRTATAFAAGCLGENVIEGELSSVTFNKKIRQKDLAILLTKLGHKGCCIFLDNLKKFLQKY